MNARLEIELAMPSDTPGTSAVFVDSHGEVWADDLAIGAALTALVDHPAMVHDEHSARCLAIAQWAIQSAVTKDHKTMVCKVWESVAQPSEWMYGAMVWLETTAKCPQKELRTKILPEVLAGTDPQFAELTEQQCSWAMGRLDESLSHTPEVAAKLSVEVGAFGYSRDGDVDAKIERARRRFDAARRQHAKGCD